MFKAVLFDMDGLMFGTEALAKKAWLVVGKDLGLPVTDELVYKVIGMNQEGVRRTCLEHLGEDFDFDGFRERVARYMEQEMDESGVPVKRGLRELLNFLAQNHIPAAVASSSSRATVEGYLDRAGLTSFFSALICGDMITHGKPAPDIFLTAAKALNTPPESCLVLEDSRNGILAAHAAGIPAVMVPDLIPPTDDLRRLVLCVCESLLDVIPILQNGADNAR